MAPGVHGIFSIISNLYHRMPTPDCYIGWWIVILRKIRITGYLDQKQPGFIHLYPDDISYLLGNILKGQGFLIGMEWMGRFWWCFPCFGATRIVFKTPNFKLCLGQKRMSGTILRGMGVLLPTVPVRNCEWTVLQQDADLNGTLLLSMLACKKVVPRLSQLFGTG